MKTILFPTDFSAVSDHAFEYCLHLAERLDAWILLYHAHHYSRLDVELVPEGMLQAFEQQEEAKALSYLRKYEEEVQKRLGKKVKVMHKLDFGFPKEQILYTCKEVKPDLLVMGTTGASSMLNRFLGSVTSHVIQHAPCPVMAIPAAAPFQPISRIAYATNFEEDDMGVFERLEQFASLLEASITLVHIRQVSKGWDLLKVDFFNELFKEKIQTEQMELFMKDCPDIVDGLNEFVQQQDIHVLAMLTHKRNLLEQLVSRSITKKMALNTRVPLLTFQKETVGQLVC